MVEGFSPMNTAFIDLDGTLIAGNSMKLFMVWLPMRLLKKGKAVEALKAVWHVALRALRITDHSRMKWNLTSIARRSLDFSDWESIADRILRRLNPEVDRFIKSRRTEGDRLCLATAAPAEYAERIARNYGMEYVLATRFTPDFSDYSENNGVRKLNAIRNLIEGKKLGMTVFLTDHHDDLPTIRAYPGKTLLVNPSPKTRELCREEKISGIKRL